MKTISKLQYITQAKSKEAILEEVKQVIQAGIDWIQLRIKDDKVDFKSVAQAVKKITDKHGVTLIFNDKVELVKELGADGVHVGLTDMPIPEVRAMLGSDKIIGGTANTFADAKNVELFGADYIGLGPYKFTSTKKQLSPILGLEGYKKIIPKSETYGWSILEFSIPIIAIGGIEVSDVSILKSETSVYGVALSSLIFKSNQKQELVASLKQALLD